jgi:Sulfotransferase family
MVNTMFSDSVSATRPFKPRTNLRSGKLYVRSFLEGVRHRGNFADVERYCFFLGYGRSGHTLLGELLNAHREVVVSNELDTLKYVTQRFTRAQVFGLILERDRAFGAAGRVWTGYDYMVPNQFQGRCERLRVIGDKKGGTTSLRLERNPDLLETLRRMVRVPIRTLHVTRNPFDNIGRLHLRRQTTLEWAIKHYEAWCRGVKIARTSLSSDEILDIRYEDFVSWPEGSLVDMCKFLGVEPYPDYLADCTSIVHAPTQRARDLVEWPIRDRDRVLRLIDEYEVLHGYEFSS